MQSIGLLHIGLSLDTIINSLLLLYEWNYKLTVEANTFLTVAHVKRLNLIVFLLYVSIYKFLPNRLHG